MEACKKTTKHNNIRAISVIISVSTSLYNSLSSCHKHYDLIPHAAQQQWMWNSGVRSKSRYHISHRGNHYNERHGVWNHRLFDCLFNSLWPSNNVALFTLNRFKIDIYIHMTGTLPAILLRPVMSHRRRFIHFILRITTLPYYETSLWMLLTPADNKDSFNVGGGSWLILMAPQLVLRFYSDHNGARF